MKTSDLDAENKEALRSEALDWLRRLNSGEATAADAKALDRWRASSPARAAEFAEAVLFWDILGNAAQKAERDRTAVASSLRSRGRLARRGFLVGGAALAASVAGGLAVWPPLELWPSVAEFTADYRTNTGQQRQIDIGDFAAVELNTRTSINLRPPLNGSPQIELIAGEAEVSSRGGADRELIVVAGNGRVASRAASFNIRKDGSAVSVSCIAGAVVVGCGVHAFPIGAGQQVVYDAQGTGTVVVIDPDEITAWRRGLLMFRRAPLAHVIDEVNRYRSGRVILVDATLGKRQVAANFRLDRINDVVDFISKAMGIPIRSLPGGIVLVG